MNATGDVSSYVDHLTIYQTFTLPIVFLMTVMVPVFILPHVFFRKTDRSLNGLIFKILEKYDCGMIKRIEFQNINSGESISFCLQIRKDDYVKSNDFVCLRTFVRSAFAMQKEGYFITFDDVCHQDSFKYLMAYVNDSLDYTLIDIIRIFNDLFLHKDEPRVETFRDVYKLLNEEDNANLEEDSEENKYGRGEDDDDIHRYGKVFQTILHAIIVGEKMREGEEGSSDDEHDGDVGDNSVNFTSFVDSLFRIYSQNPAI